MKLFAFIFSIYILALNFTPCEDSVASDQSSETAFTQILDLEHEHNPMDLCSPFCHCQCCQISIDFVPFYSDSMVVEEFPNINATYMNSIQQDVYHSLLQPPQV